MPDCRRVRRWRSAACALTGTPTQSPNWSLGLVNGAAILATLFLGRTALVGVTSLLMASYLVGVWPDLDTQWSNAVHNVGFIAAFTWAAAMVGGRLLSDARGADTASREKAAAGGHGHASRTRLKSALGSTGACTTLSCPHWRGLPGGLDYAEDSVRQRCGSDANLVRSLNAAVDRLQTPN